MVEGQQIDVLLAQVHRQDVIALAGKIGKKDQGRQEEAAPVGQGTEAEDFRAAVFEFLRTH